MFEKMRKELYDFYLTGDAERSKSFADLCFDIMDARYEEGMTVTAQKLLQYDVISEQFDPVIFRHNPFFYETGVLTSISDGAFQAKGLGFYQANAWTYLRNEHLFIDQDPELYRLTQIQKKELLYSICGPYNDVNQHFNFNCRPFLSIGAKGIYEAAKAELAAAKNDSEKEFLWQDLAFFYLKMGHVILMNLPYSFDLLLKGCHITSKYKYRQIVTV